MNEKNSSNPIEPMCDDILEDPFCCDWMEESRELTRAEKKQNVEGTIRTFSNLCKGNIRTLNKQAKEVFEGQSKLHWELQRFYPIKYFDEVELKESIRKEAEKNFIQYIERLDNIIEDVSKQRIKLVDVLEKLLADMAIDVPGEDILSLEYTPGPPRQIKIALPEYLPRLEIFWKNWGKQTNRTEVAHRWHALVRNAVAKAEKLPDTPLEKVICCCTIFYNTDKVKREVDADNYTAKYCIDAFRKNGLLLKDSSRHLTLIQRMRYGEIQHTEFVLTEVNEVGNPDIEPWAMFPINDGQ